MAILILLDDFSPKSSKVSPKMIKELAIELFNRGNRVIVIAPNEAPDAQKLEISHEDGLEVWRFKSGPLKNIPHIQRGINESLLPFRGWAAIKKSLKGIDLQGVIFYSPSIFIGPLVKKITHNRAIPAYMILRDFFPQWLIDIGILSNRSPITHYFKYVEKINYKTATKIGVMSPNNLSLFQELHPKFAHKAEVLYNWTNPTVDNTPTEYPSIRERLNLEGKTIFFYGGNIGHAQDMANLMRLAIKLKSYPQAHFLFIGDGDEVKLIKDMAKENCLTNFSYLPYISQREYLAVLAEIDIGLFSLSKEHTAHNFPGKVFGYMAHKVPVLGSVNKNNDLIDILNSHKAGLISVNGEDDLLFNNALELLNNKTLRSELAQNAFELLTTQFSVQNAANTITQGWSNL